MKVYIDGASSGNPGPSGIGVYIILDNNSKPIEYSVPIGIATNNEAEYKALILGLEKCIELNIYECDFYSDSELLVKQMKGQYKIKHENIIPLVFKAKNLVRNFARFNLFHIPREQNPNANRLAQEASKKS